MNQTWVETGDVRLSVYEDGPSEGPPVLLVHGYPDNASVWDGVVPLLAERFRVVRYDVRGAGQSGQPSGRDGYRMERLVDDLLAVVRERFPGQAVHLVAHDWGSIQAWRAVADAPELFRSFTSISGPDLGHIATWARARRGVRHLRQVLRQTVQSWYIGAFQVPFVPELLWRVPTMRRKFRANYRDARNGLELYRANMGARPVAPARIGIPVQQVALARDPYVTPPLLEAAEPWCDQLWRRTLVAGHWAVRQRPADVARFVREFVDHVDGAPASRELRRAAVGQRPLAGQLALITGAGSGIGRATAHALAAQDVDVLCVDIDFDAAERTARELPRSGLAFQLDVSDAAATRRLAEHILAEHGTPDVVMANAGIGLAGSFLETSEDDWKRVLDVNLWGVIHTLRAFVPPLVARREGGHVVVTSSAAGVFVAPSLPAYGATKAAVLMIAQSLAGELREHGIGVSAICPGFVDTNITSTTRFAGASAEEERARQASATAFYKRRAFPPERVAAAVVDAVIENRLVVPVTAEARIGMAGMRFAPGLTRAFGRWVGSR